jgi:membrane-associated phospholipid phosphatase
MVNLDDALQRHRRPLLAASALVAVGVLACWLLAKTTNWIPHSTSFDAAVAEHAHSARLLDAAQAISGLAEPATAIVTVGVIALVAWRRDGLRAAVLVGAIASIVIVTTIAKDLPGRDTSLPSGHVAYATAVGGLVALQLVRLRLLATAAAVVVLAALMGPARLIEGAHLPVDVVTGAGLGVAWLVTAEVLGRPWVLRRASTTAAGGS